MDKIYKQAFQNSPIIQILTDDKNIIKDVNLKFCRYFGYLPEDIIGQHISFILSKNSDYLDDQEGWLKETNSYSNIWEVETKNKDIRFIAIETKNLDDGYSLTISFDLTREGHRARENNRNMEELKKYLTKSNA